MPLDSHISISGLTITAKPEVRIFQILDIISQLLDEIATPFQRLSPIFGVQQLSGTIAITVRCNRKSDFKDGGHQTGSTYISASRLDSNAVPKANPPFSGSSKTAEQFLMLGVSSWNGVAI